MLLTQFEQFFQYFAHIRLANSTGRNSSKTTSKQQLVYQYTQHYDPFIGTGVTKTCPVATVAKTERLNKLARVFLPYFPINMSSAHWAERAPSYRTWRDLHRQYISNSPCHSQSLPLRRTRCFFSILLLAERVEEYLAHRAATVGNDDNDDVSRCNSHQPSSLKNRLHCCRSLQWLSLFTLLSLLLFIIIDYYHKCVGVAFQCFMFTLWVVLLHKIYSPTGPIYRSLPETHRSIIGSKGDGSRWRCACTATPREQHQAFKSEITSIQCT